MELDGDASQGGGSQSTKKGTKRKIPPSASLPGEVSDRKSVSVASKTNNDGRVTPPPTNNPEYKGELEDDEINNDPIDTADY